MRLHHLLPRFSADEACVHAVRLTPTFLRNAARFAPVTLNSSGLFHFKRANVAYWHA